MSASTAVRGSSMTSISVPSSWRDHPGPGDAVRRSPRAPAVVSARRRELAADRERAPGAARTVKPDHHLSVVALGGAGDQHRADGLMENRRRELPSVAPAARLSPWRPTVTRVARSADSSSRSRRIGRPSRRTSSASWNAFNLRLRVGEGVLSLTGARSLERHVGPERLAVLRPCRASDSPRPASAGPPSARRGCWPESDRPRTAPGPKRPPPSRSLACSSGRAHREAAISCPPLCGCGG